MTDVKIPLIQMQSHLREEHSIKPNTDYAIIFKYGKARIFCHNVYADTILEHLREYNIPFASIHTYDDRGER
ncbi:MAG: hypothetical protein ACTSW7_00615 [Candidatus Thorarchaeota archaeon]|nr:MAG: hypothetical protein DRQ25_16410 [Candidatus Fermentibacteria bacterium]HEC72595.1 hypothetical protein [Thermoplasmatales archaeon]